MKADQPNAAQLEAHQCHKDRLASIAARAVKPPVKPVEVVVPVEVETPAQWAARQKEKWPATDIPPTKYPTVEAILTACASYSGVTRIDLESARRTANVVRPRQIAMYLAKRLTLKSLPEIGRKIGDRDHTTVLHAVRKIARLIHSDSDLAFDVAHIELSLEAA